MHLERFTRGIEILRAVAEQNKPYKHGVWFDNEDNPLDCGSAACAAGWMARDPWMQMQGLSADLENVWPTFGDLTSHEAVARFFDISVHTEEWLFLMWYYPVERTADITATMVADRMEIVLVQYRAMLRLMPAL